MLSENGNPTVNAEESNESCEVVFTKRFVQYLDQVDPFQFTEILERLGLTNGAYCR